MSVLRCQRHRHFFTCFSRASHAHARPGTQSLSATKVVLGERSALAFVIVMTTRSGVLVAMGYVITVGLRAG